MGNYAGWNRKVFHMSPEPLPPGNISSRSFGIWAASTILVSAFLLFQVQPVISKMILPWFGGSSAVWSTCMLFFQMVLLAGYAYAHWLSHSFPPRRQVLIHVGLMALALLTLPISPSDYWRPEDGSRPSLRILLVLARHVGLPYFLLSTTGPLVQSWFGRVYPGKSPYRLYALSNIGSLTALLSYPFVFEPVLTSGQQDRCWSLGFGLFAALNGVLAWYLIRHAKGAGETANTEIAPEPLETEMVQLPKAETKLLWVALPCLASVALLAVTNHLSQDVAAVPFLWVIPLSLYLLSFIICFEHDRWYQRWFFAPAALLSVLWICMIESVPALDSHAKRMNWPGKPSEGIDYCVNGAVSLANYIPGIQLDRFSSAEFAYAPLYQGLFYLTSLFFGCMLCHGELARLKPARKYLTEYFLMISAGGALGGVFVALMCPVLFVWYAELPLAQAGIFLVAGITLGLMLFPKIKSDGAANRTLRFLLCSIALGGLGTLSGNAAVRNVENELVRGVVPLVMALVGAGLAWGIVSTSRRELQVMCSVVAGLLMLSGLFGLVLGNTVRMPDKAVVAAKRSFYGAVQVKDDLIATMLLDSNSEVQLLNTNEVLRTDSAFSVEYWFRRTETKSPLLGLMQLGELPIALGTRKEDDLPIAFCQVGNSRSPEQEWNLADENWHHFSLSGDSSALRISFDGRPFHSVTWSDLEVSESELAPVALGSCQFEKATKLEGEMHSLHVATRVVHPKARPFAPPPFEETRLALGVELTFEGVREGHTGEGRWLLHGRIQHGFQHAGPEMDPRIRARLEPELLPLRYQPTTYYAAGSGVGLAIRRHPRAGRLKIGAIGLGTGTIAALAREGEEVHFYEIDQTIVDLSAEYFTYRNDSLAEVNVTLGDARLQLERETPQGFDVIAVDAFSGDAIPVHLLTRECLQVYLKHLRRNGILAIHISNRYLDLAPIVRSLAETGNMRAETFHYHANEASPIIDTQSEWMLLTKNEEFFNDPEVSASITEPRDDRVIQWTDDYSNLRDILQ